MLGRYAGLVCGEVDIAVGNAGPRQVFFGTLRVAVVVEYRYEGRCRHRQSPVWLEGGRMLATSKLIHLLFSGGRVSGMRHALDACVLAPQRNVLPMTHLSARACEPHLFP